jgi:short-subunit dehydrogenase
MTFCLPFLGTIVKIDGKVVLITGASEGIGAACARAFGRRGARLSLIARNEQKLAQVGGADALHISGDITDDATRRRLIERTLERFGAIDVLINNAGMGLYSPAWEAPLEDSRRLFELNLFAPLAMVQLVVPHMLARRSGTLVNVSSVAGKIPLPWLTLYSMSKYALGALTDGLRGELKSSGIHAMTVCPGYVKTEFQAHALGQRPPDFIRGSKGRFAITADACAEAIARGVERDARTVLTPRLMWLLVAAARLFPTLVDSAMGAINRKTSDSV